MHTPHTHTHIQFQGEELESILFESEENIQYPLFSSTCLVFPLLFLRKSLSELLG